MTQRSASLRIIVVALCVFTTIVWSGVALMLWLSVEVNAWPLWAVPMLPLVAAIVVLLWPRVAAANRGLSLSKVNASVKRQIDKDLQLFDEIL